MDDDLLFQSPDLLKAVRSGDTCVRTVYVTADDGGLGVDRMLDKEIGAREAYAFMSGAVNSWSETITDRIARWKLAGKDVELAGLRLPDGGFDADNPASQPGFEIHNGETIANLWRMRLRAMSNITGTATFSRDDVIDALAAEMNDFRPTEIRIQDKRVTLGDHLDHAYSALFADAAQQRYSLPHTVKGYVGYGAQEEPVNVSDPDAAAKLDVFLAYAKHDPDVWEECHDAASCADTAYGNWLHRQYTYALTPS